MAERSKKLRERKLIRQRESLLERAKEHRIKAETEKGGKDTTPDYWRREAERFEEQAGKKVKLIKKLSKHKNS